MEQEANKSLVIAVIITFVVAFWLGFFVGWLITGRDGKSGVSEFQNEEGQSVFDSVENTENENMENTKQAQELISTGVGTIRAEDQLASKNARVASVTLDREGWVVIHEDNQGAPGAILGAAWLPAGSHENVEVNLLRGTEAGRRYYAMLHHEINDGSESHFFNLEKDLPMQDARGNLIMISFETISSPN